MTWRMKTTNPRGEPHHFYATSVAEWKVSDSLDTLISQMKRSRFDFQVFRIDLPLDADYPIRDYVPDVPRDKIHFVGMWQWTPSKS